MADPETGSEDSMTRPSSLSAAPADLSGEIRLDVCYGSEETVQDAIGHLTAGLDGVTARVVTEHGPAGGWPVVAFAGPAGQLTALRYRYSPQDALVESVGIALADAAFTVQAALAGARHQAE